MGGIIIALSVANTLLTALNHPLLKEAFLSFAYGNRLKKLKGTVTTVERLLLDAANKGELSPTILDYVDKLKDAVYDADDLFDELVTKAQRKQLFGGDDNIFEKVRQLLPSVKTSLRVKKLGLRFKDIADDHAKFGLSINTEPHRRLRVETFSTVYAPDVVGREDDANRVIGMLLDSEMCAYFLAIVGVGGMGKTTLAKLVFGDRRITDEFPTRLWVSVSDQDGETLDVKQILSKILESLECRFDSSSSSVESLQRQYQRNLQGKKFLLVLDDIWSEKIIELDNLKKLLKIDGSKCRIIATTRSEETARIIGNGTHELKGLSDMHSRRLFEKAAFGDGEKPPELVETGEKIVKKSSNVPLSIMVIGSLLYRQPIDKWQTFERSGFNTFSKGVNEIMSILKISYDNLDPSLKSCFAYCAIFPKDYVISKETIINLWNAQGYIVPFDEDQSIENAGEEHFSVLLQRCFFVDVERDVFGDVFSFKIHDLMHDLAQKVSGKEIISVINSSMPDLECSVRHLGVSRSEDSNIPTSEYILHHLKIKPRSYLIWGSWEAYLENEFPTFELPTNWGYLRALVVQRSNVKRLSDKIGNLLHLRYLNLAHSRMKKLPDSIVKLHNLQTLNMNKCVFLDEWPKEFSKLVNLTHLYVDFCYKLSCMPVGMSKMSRIRRLTSFMVEDESASGMQRVGQLKDLKALATNLKGSISIHFKENFKITKGQDWDGSILEGAKYLDGVKIIFCCFIDLLLSKPHSSRENGEEEEVVMEKLKPHPNLRRFVLHYYDGEKIASWGRARDDWATFLPNLVHIELHRCHKVQELPLLNKLQHLKILSLRDLRNLEYIEEEITSSSGSGSMDTVFFPSLELLYVCDLHNLISWRRPGDCSETHCQPAFPILSMLVLSSCHQLKTFPPCLGFPEIYLTECNEVAITTSDGVHTSTS